MTYKDKYKNWIDSPFLDEESKKELLEIKDEKEIEDRFYKDLEFGTGGLRGIIGVGSNRMNIYTVGKATQGLASYLLSKYKDKASITIAYDSRIMSKEFATRAAEILCANNIKVNLFEGLRPVPMLSFAVRHLKTKAGIVITASHNPRQYNGYKVYGEDGGQVTDEAAKAILQEINTLDYFEGIKTLDVKEAKNRNLLTMIGEEVDTEYIDTIKGETIREDLVKEHAKDLNIIYTPIHGSGNMPVRRVLTELGYSNLNIVKEQEEPDGTFPTTSYPNPENKDVFNIALKMAEEVKPDIIFGTDPDADRIGIVVKDSVGEYKVLTGNQTGVLMTHYILMSLKELNKLPTNGVVIKTIVTSEMARKICEDYNVEIMDVLTGFKYIGEKMEEFDTTKANTYLFGFEESYGSLVGTHARDKDAVVAAMNICEMTLYYKNKGLSLYDAYMELCNKYGFYKEDLVSLELTGKEGQEKIQSSLENLRKEKVRKVENTKVEIFFDYKEKVEENLKSGENKEIKLPTSNVLKYILEDGSWFVVRPSGTEPKMKIYLSVVGTSLIDANKKSEEFKTHVMEIVNNSMK